MCLRPSTKKLQQERTVWRHYFFWWYESRERALLVLVITVDTISPHGLVCRELPLPIAGTPHVVCVLNVGHFSGSTHPDHVPFVANTGQCREGNDPEEVAMAIATARAGRWSQVAACFLPALSVLFICTIR